MNRGLSAWLPQAILIALLYLLAALVEPCDGHSCANDQPTITE